MILVDTNVLIDLLTDDPIWAGWSETQLRQQAQAHKLAINPVIYAELSFAFNTIEALDKVLNQLEVALVDTPRPALFLAGKAFGRYRGKGGHKTGVLADFFIGAHAAVAGWPLLTRDPRRYRAYFPSVVLVTP